MKNKYSLVRKLIYGTAIILLTTCSLGGDLETWREKAIEANGPGPGPGVPNIEMVWIPAGTFTMGSYRFGETQHEVTLDGFYMGKYEVTQEQYQAVIGLNPSGFMSGSGAGEGNLPVERVSWFDAVEYCNKLSEMTGRTPVYTITDRVPDNGYPITNATVTANWNNSGYRLPTEAEWEYACRAGTTTNFNTGDTITSLQANYNGRDNILYGDGNPGTFLERTSPVGSYEPNEWGLYDMHGNVGEWCWDWYDGYPTEAQTNPKGPSYGVVRLHRGGSWAHSDYDCLSSTRSNSAPDYVNDKVGFRLVRPAPIITINTQPAATTNVTFGNISGSLSITASITDGATISYQWYESTSADNTDGVEIPGATNASFTIPTTLSAGSYYYFCELGATGGGISVRSSVASVFVTLASSSGLEMVWVPAGTFTMGSPGGEEGRFANETQRQVSLSGFYMGKHAVTQALYRDVMGTDPSYFSRDKGRLPEAGETDNKRPVESITWLEAVEFCNTLSLNESLTPVYTIIGETVTANWNNSGYRLPTEAEWEYACRAGTTTAYNTGTVIDAGTGWYNSNSGNFTHEVGLKPANAIGLYDMHGNVWEWCWDWYGDYPAGAEINPKGPADGINRVSRGGGWAYGARFQRSAYRGISTPDDPQRVLGFRVVKK